LHLKTEQPDFLERVNEFLKDRIDKRFANAPSAEQVEHHLAQSEETCQILGHFVVNFLYELSWLEENDRRHKESLGEELKARLTYLQKRCEDLAGMLTAGTESENGEEPAPHEGGQ
jgi:hypothetical protein